MDATISTRNGVCGRCSSKMFRTRHVEHEEWMGQEIRVYIFIDECPICSLSLKCVIPTLVGEE